MAAQWHHVAGATSATLNLAALGIINYGTYRVVVDDGAYSTTSSSATVLPPNPTVAASPSSVIVPFGLATSLSGLGVTSSGVTNYQWMRASPLVNVTGANYSGMATPTLDIASVQSASVGPYALRIGDGFNFVTSSVATVSIALQPRVTSTFSGSTLNLTFPTEIGPKYVVEWKGALTNGVWNRLVTNGGTGSPITVPASTLPDEQRFFRIRMQ